MNKMYESPILTPKHCADVAVINVGEGFDPEKIIQNLIGKLTFYSTKYIILRERDGELKANERVSIIRVKTEGGDLLKKIVDGEVLALPDKCTTMVVPNFDEFVLNQRVLKTLSFKLNDHNAVIISGRNNNITFVYLGKQEVRPPIKVLLVDTIPPSPNRLEVLARLARTSGLISNALIVENLDVDTTEIFDETLKKDEAVFTLCSTREGASLHESIANFKTITQYKASDNSHTLNINLIGCSLSQSVLKKLKKTLGLNLEITLRDICPLHKAREVAAKVDAQGLIVRCCKMIANSKKIHVNSKPVIVLPWTPTLGDLIKAIDDLVVSILGLEVE